MTAGHFLAFTALVPDEDIKFSDDASSSSLSLSFAFSLSFLKLGRASSHGIMSFLAVLFSVIALLKVEDLGEIEPDHRRTLNKLTDSAGEGVARISPVEVRTTPFIAEGI